MIKRAMSATTRTPARARGKASPRKPARRAVPKGPSLKLQIKTFFALIFLGIEVVLATVLVSMLIVFWNFTSTELPNIETFNTGSSEPKPTRILSEDGVELGRLEVENRHPITLKELGKSKVSDATIAIEDHRFYEHPGVDVWGIGRAVLADAKGKSSKQGASTLTQQLVRQPGMGAQFGLNNEKRLSRKIREALVAIRIEQLYTKQDIIQLYLNNVYYGAGAYGIQAASMTYFKKPASKLTLSEAAMLSGIPQNPVRLSPNRHFDAAMRRRDEVLDAMLEYKKINQKEYDKARAETPVIKKIAKRSHNDFKAPYFTSYVLHQLMQNYSADTVYSGLTIRTTLNWKLQRMMEKSLYEGIDGSGCANQGAMVSIDPQTGYIRAMVGGRDYKALQFNCVTQGSRQPGSTFKVFDYTAAFDLGQTSLDDADFEDKPIPYPNDPSHLVKNFGESGVYAYTRITNRSAIMQSKNTIAVQVAASVGIKEVIRYANRMGIRSKLDPVLPTALGASSVHPLDLCSAYSLFAANGHRALPMAISSIADADNNRLDPEKYVPKIEEMWLKESTVHQIDDALRGVVEAGTGMKARGNAGNGIVENAHGKTGTTTDARDVWFAGYTPELTTVVWMASAHRRGKHLVYQGMGGQAQGGRLCAPIWHDFMIQAIPIQREYNLKQANAANLAQAVKSPQVAPVVKKPKPLETPIPDLEGLPDPTDDATAPEAGDGVIPIPGQPDTAAANTAVESAPPTAKPPVMKPDLVKPVIASPTKPALPAQITALPTPAITTERITRSTPTPGVETPARPHASPETTPSRPRNPAPPPKPEPAMTNVQICGDSGGLKNPYCDTFKMVRMTVEQARKLRKCRIHKPPPGENE